MNRCPVRLPTSNNSLLRLRKAGAQRKQVKSQLDLEWTMTAHWDSNYSSEREKERKWLRDTTRKWGRAGCVSFPTGILLQLVLRRDKIASEASRGRHHSAIVFKLIRSTTEWLRELGIGLCKVFCFQVTGLNLVQVGRNALTYSHTVPAVGNMLQNKMQGNVLWVWNLMNGNLTLDAGLAEDLRWACVTSIRMCDTLPCSIPFLVLSKPLLNSFSDGTLNTYHGSLVQYLTALTKVCKFPAVVLFLEGQCVCWPNAKPITRLPFTFSYGWTQDCCWCLNLGTLVIAVPNDPMGSFPLVAAALKWPCLGAAVCDLSMCSGQTPDMPLKKSWNCSQSFKHFPLLLFKWQQKKRATQHISLLIPRSAFIFEVENLTLAFSLQNKRLKCNWSCYVWLLYFPLVLTTGLTHHSDLSWGVSPQTTLLISQQEQRKLLFV